MSKALFEIMEPYMETILLERDKQRETKTAIQMLKVGKLSIEEILKIRISRREPYAKKHLFLWDIRIL